MVTGRATNKDNFLICTANLLNFVIVSSISIGTFKNCKFIYNGTVYSRHHANDKCTLQVINVIPKWTKHTETSLQYFYWNNKLHT